MNAISRIRSFAVLLPAAVLLLVAPALARESYVQDGAHLLNQTTIDGINSEVGAFSARTGKEVLVVTVPSLNSTPINDVVERTFAQNQVNGVLIFLAKDEKQGRIVGDKAARTFFPAGTFQNIYDGMRGYLRSGDYDGAVKTGVNLTLDQYRSHEGARTRSGAVAPVAAAPVRVAETPTKSSFGGIGLFWLFVLLIVGFFVIRAIFRAMSRPKQIPPGYGGPLPGPGPMPGPGFGGQPGYGPGYGGGGGMGGGFFSGLLGGLGGAFIGNQLFGRRDEPFVGGDSNQAGLAPGAGQDASGWQSDAGQVDSSNAGGGGWGDSGGSGGGDFGGGGGGDFGGGGGGDGGW